MTLPAVASSSWEPYKLVSAATTNATSLLDDPGLVGFVHVVNTNAAARFLKFYDKASAPTVGTDTPKLTLAIPGDAAGAGFTLTITNGVYFENGIAFALTTGAADNDTNAVASGEIVLNLGYRRL